MKSWYNDPFFKNNINWSYYRNVFAYITIFDSLSTKSSIILLRKSVSLLKNQREQ